MQNMHEWKKTNDSHAGYNKRMGLMENQIHFLREECNFKNQIDKLPARVFNNENRQIKLYNGNIFDFC